MGSGSWNASTWETYKTRQGINSKSTVQQLYTATKLHKDLNPYNVVRESCDSDEHPNSNAIILGLDVTGSMGYLAEEIAKGALNTLIHEIYDNNSLTDPQIMIAAIGDGYCDEAPLQVSQFESDIRIAEQLQQIWFEGGGGGNGGESYSLLYYFAARHTSIDCMRKRKQKGILYTIGDECTHLRIPSSHIKQFLGDDEDHDLSFQEIYDEVSKSYEVYHLIVGDHEYHGSLKSWRKFIGERAMVVEDVSRIPQIIEATLELKLGKKLEDILDKYDSSTAMVVKGAVMDLAKRGSSITTTNSSDELVEF